MVGNAPKFLYDTQPDADGPAAERVGKKGEDQGFCGIRIRGNKVSNGANKQEDQKKTSHEQPAFCGLNRRFSFCFMVLSLRSSSIQTATYRTSRQACQAV
jgi:hypothetical protein